VLQDDRTRGSLQVDNIAHQHVLLLPQQHTKTTTFVRRGGERGRTSRIPNCARSTDQQPNGRIPESKYLPYGENPLLARYASKDAPPKRNALLSIELRHIKYFIAVAEELNFSREAARLHIAQPPLSVQIQDLERRLGVQLFDRSGRRTALTPEGEVFLMEVREIIEQVSPASHAVNQVAHGALGRVRVTGISSAFPTVLADIVPGFRAERPHLMGR
jgi:hypothetical protein